MHECACVPFDPSDPARAAWQSPVNVTWIQWATIQDGFNLLTHNLFYKHTLMCETICRLLKQSLYWWEMLLLLALFIFNRAEVTKAGEKIYYLHCLWKVPSEQHSIHSVFAVRGIIRCLKQCRELEAISIYCAGWKFYNLCVHTAKWQFLQMFKNRTDTRFQTLYSVMSWSLARPDLGIFWHSSLQILSGSVRLDWGRFQVSSEMFN